MIVTSQIYAVLRAASQGAEPKAPRQPSLRYIPQMPTVDTLEDIKELIGSNGTWITVCVARHYLSFQMDVSKASEGMLGIDLVSP